MNYRIGFFKSNKWSWPENTHNKCSLHKCEWIYLEENLFYIGSNSNPNKRKRFWKRSKFHSETAVQYATEIRVTRFFPCDNMLGLLVYYWSYNRVSFYAMLKQNIQIWKINNAESEVRVAVITTEWWHNTIYNKFTPPIPVLGSFHSIHQFMSGYLSRIKQLFLIPCSNLFQNLANT